MPQRANSRADLGNSKRASDTYDNNNIFLTDQGWVYRHFKGNPTDPDVRYWDEILVAGQVNPEDRTAMGDFFEDSADYQPTIYLDADGNEVSRENSNPFYPLATGNQKYPHPAPLGAYEPDGSQPGSPDGIYDIEYASHLYDGVEVQAKPAGPYMDHYENELTNAEGMVKPPGVEDLGYYQFPEVDPYNPSAPNPGAGGGGGGSTNPNPPGPDSLGTAGIQVKNEGGGSGGISGPPYEFPAGTILSFLTNTAGGTTDTTQSVRTISVEPTTGAAPTGQIGGGGGPIPGYPNGNQIEFTAPGNYVVKFVITSNDPNWDQIPAEATQDITIT